MPPLHLRQEFPTLKAFKEALHAWAIEAHFEPRILKSDTGRVRVGCKRDPECPFVVRCNWERKNNREPLARVTVLKERHTCLNALEWRGGGGPGGPGGNGNVGGGGGGGGGVGGGGGGGMGGMVNNVNGGAVGVGGMGNGVPMALEIRQDENGNILGGARVLGPVTPRRDSLHQLQQSPQQGITPVLPKVQRNSASRLPFLKEILPRLMEITKETTPGEIRDCLLRNYGQEVHLQQCRRAKTEILKMRDGGGDGGVDPPGQGGVGVGMDGGVVNVGVGVNVGSSSQGHGHGQGGQSIDGLGSDGPDGSSQLFGNMNGGGSVSGMNPGPAVQSPDFPLHTASGVVIPQVQSRKEAALNAVGEQPVRCPFCRNSRWMNSIKDAVEHMSMHVVV